MAKKSSIEKNNRRKRMTKNAAPARAKLKAIIADKKRPMEERFALCGVLLDEGLDPLVAVDGAFLGHVLSSRPKPLGP